MYYFIKLQHFLGGGTTQSAHSCRSQQRVEAEEQIQDSRPGSSHPSLRAGRWGFLPSPLTVESKEAGKVSLGF